MNREIKFRAWDTIDKDFKFNYYERKPGHADSQYKILIALDGTVYEKSIYDNVKTEKSESNRFIVMQYTGLKDKNGKEIYEGDIVDCEERWTTPKIVRYEIRFDVGEFCGWSIKHVKVQGKGQRMVILKPDEMDECEIIGNIYENPELLPTQPQS